MLYNLTKVSVAACVGPAMGLSFKATPVDKLTVDQIGQNIRESRAEMKELFDKCQKIQTPITYGT